MYRVGHSPFFLIIILLVICVVSLHEDCKTLYLAMLIVCMSTYPCINWYPYIVMIVLSIKDIVL